MRLIYQVRSEIDGEGWHEVTVIDMPHVHACARLLRDALRKLSDALRDTITLEDGLGVPRTPPRHHAGEGIHAIEVSVRTIEVTQ